LKIFGRLVRISLLHFSTFQLLRDYGLQKVQLGPHEPH
jgi:hypothetical protein